MWQTTNANFGDVCKSVFQEKSRTMEVEKHIPVGQPSRHIKTWISDIWFSSALQLSTKLHKLPALSVQREERERERRHCDVSSKKITNLPKPVELVSKCGGIAPVSLLKGTTGKNTLLWWYTFSYLTDFFFSSPFFGTTETDTFGENCSSTLSRARRKLIGFFFFFLPARI